MSEHDQHDQRDRDDERTEVLPDPEPTSGPTHETAWAPADVDEEHRTGFHALQSGYLVAGVVAIGVALTWLLSETGTIEGGDGGTAFSVVLVLAGAAGLLATFGRAMRQR